ncbi:MAG: hypothetical protein A3G34_09235 [Candidatus Lindowbacteria bacterium RIFCSPLOWO2_12_FULL_62_27]|nr:MAG: hypothetical protein A3I06_07900 [Candidatus Lindowbacteria bacterium RIFCSPLOWO2_02_FULL_62_12]OGH60223.1 MAG: hypothetical protein A3G34_09235 [Candidatus Lindowbacteria bacterium RIFCSPLOWO2_12_FULL_62_27]
MREFNALGAYPQPGKPRYVGPHLRGIRNRIAASYRDREYYDGDRNNGYGGYRYDGRWKAVVDTMTREYGLNENSAVLQIGCEKGFLLHDFKERFPGMKLRGYEVSPYAIENSMPSVRPLITQGRFEKLPFQDHEFDLVIAVGVVYTMTLADALSCLREIGRVGKGKSFITLGSYRDEQGFKLFKMWSVLGATILHVDEWQEVLKEAGYTGDYFFMTSDVLNLVEETPK